MNRPGGRLGEGLMLGHLNTPERFGTALVVLTSIVLMTFMSLYCLHILLETLGIVK